MTTPSPLRAALHFAVIWSFAVARPLFETLSDDPSFFVGRGSTGLDIVAFALLLIAGPALIALGLIALADRFRPSLGPAVRIVLLGAAGLLLGLELAKQVAPGGSAAAIYGAGLATAAGVAAAYARTEFLPSTLTVLAPAPVLFAALFLLTAPISKLLFAEEPAAPAERAERAPVVVVVFDEFPLATLMRPGGTVDESRFPSFARLAAESRWHRGAVTVSSFTHVAVPALLTGEIGETRVPSAAVHPRSVFTALSGTHEMDVVEPVTEVCPETVCGERERDGAWDRMTGLAEDLFLVEKHRLLPESVTRTLPPIDQGFAHFVDLGRSAEVQDETLAFTRRLAEPGPVLHYLHNPFLPHPPWERLPDGTRYEPVISGSEFEEGVRNDLVGGPGAVESVWQRHMLQAGYADRVLGEMIATMERAGTWEDSLVIVAADHGASFKLGASRRTVGSKSLGGIGPVPLFVKRPGGDRAGTVSDELTCISEIPALLSEALSVSPPLGGGECEREPEFFDRVGAKRIRRSLEGVVRTQAELFAPGGGWRAVYGAFDERELTGTPLTKLQLGEPLGVTATLEEGTATGARGEDLPVSPLVVAETSEALDPDARVAVAQNGRIVAVGAAYDAPGAQGIAAIIPPALITEGALSLYGIEPGPGGELRPIDLG